MKRIDPDNIAELGQHLSDSPDEAISLGVLARKLGVSFEAARRRLDAYAAAHGLTLRSTRARVGGRGPESTTWYLEKAPPTHDPIDPSVRVAFMSAIPHDLENALPRRALLAKVRASLPRELKRSTVTSSLAGLLLDAPSGVVITDDGLVYLEASSARTQRVAAVARRKKASTSAPQRKREVVTREVRAIGSVVDASDDAALGLAPEVRRALTSDELTALRLLAKSGTARTTELAASVGHSPARVGGMMRALRRKLPGLFVDDDLPDGETMFRYVKKEER